MIYRSPNSNSLVMGEIRTSYQRNNMIENLWWLFLVPGSWKFHLCLSQSQLPGAFGSSISSSFSTKTNQRVKSIQNLPFWHSIRLWQRSPFASILKQGLILSTLLHTYYGYMYILRLMQKHLEFFRACKHKYRDQMSTFEFSYQHNSRL